MGTVAEALGFTHPNSRFSPNRFPPIGSPLVSLVLHSMLLMVSASAVPDAKRQLSDTMGTPQP